MWFAIVNVSTLEIVHKYQGIVEWGGDWATSKFNHVQIPDGLDPNTVIAIKEDEIVEDPIKVQIKIDNQWDVIRFQQRQKLSDSDWTCSVVDTPPEILAQREQWIIYRQALRDITTQTDPFNIIWPTPPS
jgi:hypothetical protein